MKITDVKWLIDSHMMHHVHRGDGPNLSEALQELGHTVFCTALPLSLHDASEHIPRWKDECVVVYGSYPFVRKSLRARQAEWQPGAFLNMEELSYSSFAAHHGEVLLNDDFVIMPFAELKRRGLDAWDGAAFIRPNAVTKSFAGFVIDEENFSHEINALEKVSYLQPTEPVVVASAKKIILENRFVIAAGRVSAGSSYSWTETDHPTYAPAHPDCVKLANQIARHPWQPDSVYVCDIALTERDGRCEARLLEMNSFSCAGLYGCDVFAVARDVSAAALDEWQDCGV